MNLRRMFPRLTQEQRDSCSRVLFALKSPLEIACDPTFVEKAIAGNILREFYPYREFRP